MNQSKRWPSRPGWGRSFPAIALLPLLAILLLPGAVLGQSRPAPPAVSDHGAVLLEGVVIAPRLGVAYLMHSGGGIDAVDLASGAVRWRSDKASKPLAVDGDRLIAQAESRGANSLHLVALDTRSGASRDSVRIPLPAGVAATATDTAAGSFRIRAEATGSELAVHWEATGVGQVAQGILPAENEGQAPSLDGAPSVASGAAIIDLASSSLRVKEEPAVRLAHTATLSRSAMQELSEPAVKGTTGRQMLSADGRHVLVTEPIESTGASLDRYRWTVYERASGTRLGVVPSMVSATPFVVVGRTLYHTVPAHAISRDGKLIESPFSLRAVDLKTGAQAWTKVAGETEFRGPFPP